MVILPYKLGSSSAKAIAQALKLRRVRHDGNFRNNYNHVTFNWGSSVEPSSFSTHRYINPPERVRIAANKRHAFESLREAGVPTPNFTTDQEEAARWIEEEEKVVVCRTILNGHSGRGITLSSTVDELVRAPLYVEYIKKMDEYRYHVFNGRVIDIQQKKKRREVDNDNVDYQIRNKHTGWVYCRSDINPPNSLNDIAVNSVVALGLDFGAVDIIWNEKQQQGYVLEVNTACGIEGTTLDSYVNAIREMM